MAGAVRWRPMLRVNYDGRACGLGKLNDRRVFASLVVLADLGMLQVDGATGLGWIELATATEDLLTLGPPARKTYPRRLNYDFPR